jgi:ATP-dependent exoDNAse (exonuclease V) alpha subunit
VSEFLQRGTLSRGSVLIVDEAGQISGKQMHALLSLARETNSRIILSGDTRQHGPVEASDALRAIERYSNVRTAQLNNIRRQDPERAKNARERDAITTYRAAVKAASEGDLAESFEKLEALGAVVECSEAERATKLVESYLAITTHNDLQSSSPKLATKYATSTSESAKVFAATESSATRSAFSKHSSPSI